MEESWTAHGGIVEGGSSTGVAPNACEKATRKVRGGYIKLGD